MLRAIVTVVMALSVASASGSACAMKSSSSEPPRCRVVGGDKLPAGAGGEQAVCAAIEGAVAAEAPGSAANIEVRVISASSLAATIRTADGRTLPEQRMATMDRSLTESSIQRFARAIAAEVAKAAGH
jgi:hypothetical protein